MTAPAITIDANRPIAEAARLMTLKKVNRFAGRRGRSTGRHRHTSRPGRRVCPIGPGARGHDPPGHHPAHDVARPDPFQVQVKDGIARISGHVERRSTADMIGQASNAVPGIVDVETSITWSMDDSKIQPEPIDMVTSLGPR